MAIQRMRRRITTAKREQIEKEQEAISKSIVRPFDVIGGMPVSYSLPPYGEYEKVLKNPLTVKDSGILYRSLMKSRNNYIMSCPMFQLYWVKQSSYARKLMVENKLAKPETDRPPILGPEINARDVMVKLGDAGMTLGPHSFEVRLFIAKDDRSEKKKEEDKEKAAKEEDIGLIPTEPIETPVKSEAEAIQEPESSLPAPSNPVNAAAKPPVPTNSVTSTSGITSVPQISNSTPTPVLIPKPSAPTGATPQYGTPAPPVRKVSKHDPTNLDSPDNVMIIQNLHAVAKVDPNLRMLMLFIAEGNGDPHQLALFQGYVARAREMGPSPHHFLIPNFRLDPHIPLKHRKYFKERKYNKAMKDQKLTAFQEKYLSDATLVFEFLENSNTRYLLPKQAIAEVLPSDKSSEERNILLSFLWIHNRAEVEEYEAALEEYLEESKKREEEEKAEEKRKQEDEERQRQIAEGKIPDEPVEVASKPRRKAFRRGKKMVSKAPKKLVEPQEPEIKFTPVSFTLHDIPTRFVSMIINSLVDENKTREYMKRILAKGVRSSSLNLWYQVDGKLDEKLAENIRAELVTEEKKMLGYSTVPGSTIAKKRKL